MKEKQNEEIHLKGILYKSVSDESHLDYSYQEDDFQKSRRPLVILTGPTAVGKTELSIRLAKAIGGEIISADSMQVYRGMDIGSAKIRPEEMDGIPHHLIDILEPDEEFHVVRFQELAKMAMQEIWSRGHIPILTGGTGFYIQAVLYDIDFTDAVQDDPYRRMLEETVREQGPEALHRMLQEADPAAAAAIHPNNVKRVIRALEYHRETGEKISEHNIQERQKQSPYAFAYFVLNQERSVLYERIDRRVDKMLEEGLLDEVRRLKEQGCTRDMVSMQGLGYKEMLEYLDGELSYEEAVHILKRDTRHFAKRQLTWFRRERDVIWLDKDLYRDGTDQILQAMLDVLSKRNILPADRYGKGLHVHEFNL